MYTEICNGIKTKWVTETEWNYGIKISIVNQEIMYKDNNGKNILVYEDDEDEWSEW